MGNVNSAMTRSLLPSCTYSKVVLTIIALLLSWNTFFRDPISLVHAQPTATTYRAEWIETG